MSLVLQPGVKQAAGLPSVDQTAITEDVVYSRGLQPQVALDRLKEARYFPRRKTHRLDVVPRQRSANMVEYRPNIRQEGD
jgi:hypothetical protein